MVITHGNGLLWLNNNNVKDIIIVTLITLIKTPVGLTVPGTIPGTLCIYLHAQSHHSTDEET